MVALKRTGGLTIQSFDQCALVVFRRIPLCFGMREGDGETPIDLVSDQNVILVGHIDIPVWCNLDTGQL